MVKKKESSVLLGIPDGSIEVDDDVYASKMGGLPLWLDPDRPMASEYCQCKVCGDWMYLLFQSYAPLVDSAYHRVLYVWGCNKRACMKKEGRWGYFFFFFFFFFVTVIDVLIVFV
ncbi:hypothetical protein BY458DRAFT_440403 [Sporodiniella umbellata]|nr:hypothetical protein BY458DRAFT_440403 [Sporodiniella umbellata]